MAYGVVHHFAGGTQDQYEASIAAVHPSDGSLPEGQLFHAAGPSAGGWTIIAVHESQESWESFRDGILMPNMGAGIEAASALRPRPAVTVVITDGYTPWPAAAPKGMRVVAGLLGDDAPAAPAWARSVRVSTG